MIEKRAKLRDIIGAGRSEWDVPLGRRTVRQNFQKVVDCKTPALGAEVFASASQTKIAYHTCKSRFCVSCGARATQLWQRRQWSALPNVPYSGLVFTMPDILWPAFGNDERQLLRDLPALAAATVKHWAKTRHGADVFVMAIKHTFGRRLNFHPHVHLLVSRGGLLSNGEWVHTLELEKHELRRLWTLAVTEYLRLAFHKGLLPVATGGSFLQVLSLQERRLWNIHVDRFKSKFHFLQYAGRYLLRPPLRDSQILFFSADEVHFGYTDTRSRSRAVAKMSRAEFLGSLARHVPERYAHGMRYFGLLGPRIRGRSIFHLEKVLGLPSVAPPPRQTWRHSLMKKFGVDPLRDSHGVQMRWIRRLSPSNVK